MWPGKHIFALDCMSSMCYCLTKHPSTSGHSVKTFLIMHAGVRLCWVASALHYVLVMWSVARFHMLVFGLGLVVFLVKFLLLSMSEIQRHPSEIVTSVRPMLRIGTLSPPWDLISPACCNFLIETKIDRYSSSRNCKTTTSQDLCV